MRLAREFRIHRSRRDRTAHHVALTFTAVLALLAIGGGWWLVTPHEGSAGHRVDPLAVLAPSTEYVSAVPTPMPEITAEAPIEAPAPPKPTGLSFNGRPLRKAKTLRMLVTAYSPDARSCGDSADNITASGYSVWTNAMKLVAADPRVLRYGSVISVPGYDEGNPVPVLDCGGAIKGNRLDVLFPTHEIARRWGKRWVDVTVWKYAD